MRTQWRWLGIVVCVGLAVLAAGCSADRRAGQAPPAAADPAPPAAPAPPRAAAPETTAPPAPPPPVTVEAPKEVELPAKRDRRRVMATKAPVEIELPGMFTPIEPLPSFPWPPPPASARDQLSAAWLINRSGTTLLGDVDNRLRAALDAAGYTERKYMAAPGGFVLVTRLEQMEPDGTPKPGQERWAAEPGPLRRFSLGDYLRALLTANPGYYRVMALVVTPEAFAETGAPVSREAAMAWLTEGLNRLPEEVASIAWTSAFSCTALVYEFELPDRGGEARQVLPGRLTGRTHLDKAHLLAALRGGNP